jgi:hypothetical protein
MFERQQKGIEFGRDRKYELNNQKKYFRDCKMIGTKNDDG